MARTTLLVGWLVVVVALAGCERQSPSDPGSGARAPASRPAAAESRPGTIAIDWRGKRSVMALADLEALGPEDVTWTFRDQPHAYRGVKLDKLLERLGFEPGPGGKDIAVRDRRPG